MLKMIIYDICQYYGEILSGYKVIAKYAPFPLIFLRKSDNNFVTTASIFTKNSNNTDWHDTNTR